MTPEAGNRQGLVCALLVLCLSLAGCAIDFGASVPCAADSDCPVEQRCDLAFQRCVDGESRVEERDAGAGEDASEDVGEPNDVAVDAPSVDVDDADGEGADADADDAPDVPDSQDGTSMDAQSDADADIAPSDTTVEDADGCTPSTEVCDGADNDCDGAVDEDGVCEGCGPHAVEVVRDGAAPYCIDVYEASRPDATATSAGVDSSRAVSQPGVLPWSSVTFEQASAACEASGRRLCTATEWVDACQGPSAAFYPYGNGYDGLACNGANTPPLRDAAPSGALERCVSADGTFDQSGNLSEWVSDLSVRGGAFEDSQLNLQCRSRRIPAASSGPSATTGFRCCADR